MKEPKSLPLAIVFLMGIAVGIIGFPFIASVLVDTKDTLSADPLPKTFGDIIIWAGKINLAEDVKKNEAHEPNSIIFKKGLEIAIAENNNRQIAISKQGDDFPFLRIGQDPNGKTVQVFLAKDKFTPVFWMEPSSMPNKWGGATYSSIKFKDEPIGESYTDINFDGCFDCKRVSKGDGKRPSDFILLEGNWQEVDRCNPKQMKATIGQTDYIFDANSGLWEESR